MTGFWPRFLTAVLAMGLGGLIGHFIGREVGWPLISAAIGGSLGVAAMAGADAARSNRLIRWLRGSQEENAPLDSGFWGEVGYRVERLIRLRDQSVERERERLAQFLSAIEASPNGVLMLDPHEHIVWCNSVAADHFGLHPRRDLGQRVTNLVRAPAFVTYLQAGRFEEPVVFVDLRTGDPRTLSVLVRPYAEGMRLVLSQDITERERSDAMRRDFVANVSHEIRTPLTVLSGFVESMANLNLTEIERRRVLTLMAQQTQRMQTLVGDLLTLARLEGSPHPPADRWQDVTALMAHVEADARALSNGRHVLSFHGVGGLQVAGSSEELLSAATNVVNNAVRYTPAGGRIDVRFGLEADGSAVLEVADTGPGIAREHIPRLTERFYRVDGSRSRETGGTGLGLSIVKHVVQRHGGELEIESELGKGSTFRIRLPAARIRAAEPVEGVAAG